MCLSVICLCFFCMDIWMCCVQSVSRVWWLSHQSLELSISEPGFANALWSFTCAFVASLSFSLPPHPHPPIVWRLRKDTGQVTVAPHWGIACCLSFCKHASSLSSTLHTQSHPPSPPPMHRAEQSLRCVCIIYVSCTVPIKGTTPKSFYL